MQPEISELSQVNDVKWEMEGWNGGRLEGLMNDESMN